MKYAAAIIITLILFAGGFFTGSYFNRKTTAQGPSTTVTVIKDTIIYKDKIVYRNRPIPEPIPAPGTPYNFYSDTLKTDSLDLVINDSIKGELISREIVHTPIIFERLVTNVEYVTKEVTRLKTPVLSLYGDVKTGGGEHGFVGAIELGIVNKNRNKIGLSVFKSNNTYFCISYGYVFPIY